MVFTGSSGFPGIIWSRAPLSTTTVQVYKVQQSAVGPVRAEGTGGTPCEFALEEHCLVQLHRGYDEACWEPSTDPWPSRKSEAQLQQYSQEKPLRATGAEAPIQARPLSTPGPKHLGAKGLPQTWL